MLRGGEQVEVDAEVVISNAGPEATVAMAGRDHFSGEYLERMDRDLRSTANIVVNVATREPLFEAPGIITFGITRRLCNMANLTATCPELAPDGRHLYVAYGVPIPAVGDFDEEAEIEATLADLRDEFEGFEEKAQILSIRVMRGDWPAQRAIVFSPPPPFFYFTRRARSWRPTTGTSTSPTAYRSPPSATSTRRPRSRRRWPTCATSSRTSRRRRRSSRSG